MFGEGTDTEYFQRWVLNLLRHSKLFLEQLLCTGQQNLHPEDVGRRRKVLQRESEEGEINDTKDVSKSQREHYL